MRKRAVRRAGTTIGFLVALILTAGLSNGGTERALGQTTPLRLEGKFSLSPTHGRWGSQFTGSATGLTPNSEYTVVWTSAEGAWKLANNDSEYQGRTYTPTESTMMSVRTDADGAVQFTGTVPNDFGFQHDVLLRRDGETRNKAGFDVDLDVTITPTSGPVGTPITIEAKGIGWRTYQNSWGLSYDNTFTGWLSAVTTKGYARAVIPATGAVGVHILTVLHGDFTFPYLNMQQSPEPDRPRFHIPFTVTDGPAVLPPPIEQQLIPVAAAQVPAGTGMWVDPPEGIVGSRAAVKGAGLPPNADVTLTWATQAGNRVSGAGFAERSDPIATVRTDDSGNFTWMLTVPDGLGGFHAMTAEVAGTMLAESGFSIQASAQPLSVMRGPSGTEFLIQLNGVGWTETANIYHTVWDNAYAGYECGFNSGGNVQVFLYASGAPGWHYIDLYPGIYKGIETRPLNFRIPQLTYEADHPGEKLPAFRFAFYITAPGE